MSMKLILVLILFAASLQQHCVIHELDHLEGDCLPIGDCIGSQFIDYCQKGFGCCVHTNTISFRSFELNGSNELK